MAATSPGGYAGSTGGGPGGGGPGAGPGPGPGGSGPGSAGSQQRTVVAGGVGAMQSVHSSINYSKVCFAFAFCFLLCLLLILLFAFCRFSSLLTPPSPCCFPSSSITVG